MPLNRENLINQILIVIPPSFNIKYIKKQFEEEEKKTNNESSKDEEEYQEIKKQGLLLEENNNINNNKKKIYICKDIINILKKNGCSESIIERIKEEYITLKDRENIYLFETKVKKKRGIKNEKLIMKRGRKTNDDSTYHKHTYESSDNIIKKLKAIFFKNVVEYVNEFINKDKFKLFFLDYKLYVDRLKKEEDLKMLSLPLKELLSLNISTKYGSNKNKDANKEIIESILKEELNESPIVKLLNMTFEEWIDIFTMKNQFDCNIMFNGLETTLMKILSKNDSDDKYFTRMIFYLYNYKRWFENKKSRKEQKSNDKAELVINLKKPNIIY